MHSLVTITSIELDRFKAFQHYSVKLQHMNLLVGANNSGKSTILCAFRLLADALRVARSKNPEPLGEDYDYRFGYIISDSSLSTPLNNIHTDCRMEESKVTFTLSNGYKLLLYFPEDGGAVLIADANGKRITSTGIFRKEFPVTIGIVPVLGPLATEEKIVTEDTIRRGLPTHRSSYHFRNYWYNYREGFESFAELVRNTWPGMDICIPSKPDIFADYLVMFCYEDGIKREISWAGFGFQVWCQLLTSLSAVTEASIIIIDEPEIYLHPDVQRYLISILREMSPDIILATHSAEIMGEADPSEILLVDKRVKSARRLRDIDGIQSVLDSIGSIHNITLSHFARTKKILFTEGITDFLIIKRFARKAGFPGIASGNGLTNVDAGGFSAWDRIKNFAWGFTKTLGKIPDIGVVFDRDYWPTEQINDMYKECEAAVAMAHIHECKEIENFLLVPDVIDRAIDGLLLDRQNRTGELISKNESAKQMLDRISDKYRNTVVAQLIEKRSLYFKKAGQAISTVSVEVLNWVNDKWEIMPERLKIVPGKEVLRDLRELCHQEYGITLTDARIISEFHRDEILNDMMLLLSNIERMRIK
jgi:energy-coupling factor transporter ATP-binding protein EcfA2